MRVKVYIKDVMSRESVALKDCKYYEDHVEGELVSLPDHSFGMTYSKPIQLSEAPATSDYASIQSEYDGSHTIFLHSRRPIG